MNAPTNNETSILNVLIYYTPLRTRHLHTLKHITDHFRSNALVASIGGSTNVRKTSDGSFALPRAVFPVSALKVLAIFVCDGAFVIETTAGPCTAIILKSAESFVKSLAGHAIDAELGTIVGIVDLVHVAVFVGNAIGVCAEGIEPLEVEAVPLAVADGARAVVVADFLVFDGDFGLVDGEAGCFGIVESLGCEIWKGAGQ
mmetsp:Transcript_18624/g.39059  ORF Transcript_18624/g.39059 Transcript_18624/m.39059 type:complete len:201 (-) Transcript_18624:348-950(-)